MARRPNAAPRAAPAHAPAADERLALALRPARPLATAGAILLLMAGFTLDDLRLTRVPAYLAGLVAALATVAVGPLWTARRLAYDHAQERDFAAWARGAQRGAYLALVAAAVAALAWLAWFSGVPSWTR